jgi:hypothetical protein
MTVVDLMKELVGRHGLVETARLVDLAPSTVEKVLAGTYVPGLGAIQAMAMLGCKTARTDVNGWTFEPKPTTEVLK